MLAELEIENLAVIAHARIPFSPRLNVFTGETGAGKSILLHGIHAVLGQRVTRDIVRTGCKKAVVTALFTHLDPLVCARLDALSISHVDDELLLTREIAADGGSAARVNGHTTTVSVLREIGDALINIHGQHDNQVLLAPECHLQILDSFGGDDTLLQEYQETFRQLQQAAKRLNQLVKLEQDKAHRRHQLKALVAEVDELGLELGEEDALEEEMNLLQHAESIAAALQAAADAIDGEDADGSAVLLTEAAAEELSPFADLRTEFSVLGERLSAAGIELADIASECRRLRDDMELDPQRYAMVQKRMLEIRRLSGNISVPETNWWSAATVRKRNWNRCRALPQRSLRSGSRRRNFWKGLRPGESAVGIPLRDTAALTAEVTEQLEFLNMPNVVLTGKAVTTGKLTIHGMDSWNFSFRRTGAKNRDLWHASHPAVNCPYHAGAECVIADRDSIPTLIFDEIDTGVSGKAAQKIGMKLREVGQLRQVLCVTHLSQIAVMADQHLMIEKQTEGTRTETHVMVLEPEGRVHEIARIMGGENPSVLLLGDGKRRIETLEDDLLPEREDGQET